MGGFIPYNNRLEHGLLNKIGFVGVELGSICFPKIKTKNKNTRICVRWRQAFAMSTTWLPQNENP